MTLNPDWVLNQDNPNFTSAVPFEQHESKLLDQRHAAILKGYEIQTARELLAAMTYGDYSEQITVADDNLKIIVETIKALDTLIERLDKPTE